MIEKSLTSLFTVLLLIVTLFLSQWDIVNSESRVLLYIGPFHSTNELISYTVHRNFKFQRLHKVYPPPGRCEYTDRSIIRYLVNSTTLDGINLLEDVPETCIFSEESILEYLERHRSNKHSLFLASEFFSLLPMEAIVKLKEMLSGFDVVVVMSYRIWIDRILQTLHDKSTKLRFPMSSFMDSHLNWFFSKQYWGNITEELSLKYGEVFGEKKIKIIDTLGTEAEGRSTYEVICCDLLKFYGGCDEEGRFNRYILIQKKRIKKPIEKYQIYQLFMQFAFAHNCDVKPGYEKMILDLKWQSPVPKTKARMTNFLKHSFEIDQGVRQKLKIMYSNEIANRNEAFNSTLAQIDRNELILSEAWREEFLKTLQKLSKKKIFYCKKKNDN